MFCWEMVTLIENVNSKLFFNKKDYEKRKDLFKNNNGFTFYFYFELHATYSKEHKNDFDTKNNFER